ncbi:peptidylprolyl isomerase [Niabella sp. 22666]|uniref:peptidylprolyl isomerase n=1 Tax=Niabella sp. 22666 TaxID=3453954 RepID=UPI003F8538B6
MCRLIVIVCSFLLFSCASQQKLRKADLKKDVVLETNYGVMRVRLSDETLQHRDNFLKLTKSKYYDGVLFHRVINQFMIQAGDPDSRKAAPGKALGEGGPGYTIPSEFRTNLFHKKGVIAAAREGDDVNPQKASSGSQFYIVQGKVWTDGGLDTLEIKRLNGRKIPSEQRTAYKTVGGTPHLDQNYTVFGEVIEGLGVIDTIAAVATSKGKDKNRPVKDVIIKKARLVKRR